MERLSPIMRKLNMISSKSPERGPVVLTKLQPSRRPMLQPGRDGTSQ